MQASFFFSLPQVVAVLNADRIWARVLAVSRLSVSMFLCLCVCDWQERARKHVGSVGWFITLGKTICLELMSDLMTAANTTDRGKRKEPTQSWNHKRPHILECDGTINLNTTAGASWWREQSINLLPHLISAYKNSMNQGSPQLTATLSFALRLMIYKVNTVGRRTVKGLVLHVSRLSVHHDVFSSII